MIGLRRLDSLQSCLETALQECIKGDLIETGVWRGGACIFMRAVMAAYGVEDRKVYVADSFEGLPAPEPEKFPADRGDELHTHTYLAVSQDEVKTNFRRFGLLDDQVVFLKGWFKDTLPEAKIEKLAVLRLDGDMYSSTMDSLTNLYPKLSDGGFCIVDDYDLDGCRKAVDEFRAANGVHAEMKAVDSGCKFWRKE
jgi:O-methyltransferase